MLSPALVLAKRDRESGALAPDDEQFVIRVTQDIVDDLVAGHQLDKLAAHETPPSEVVEAALPEVVVFGCPACDRVDELALHMFRHLLKKAGRRFELISANTLAAEVVSRAKEERPTAVCIAALPPGGLAQTRYLCKRLRAQFPDMKILVGRWGQTEHLGRSRERLLAAGANQVVPTLLEARDYLVPLIQVQAHAPERRAAV